MTVQFLDFKLIDFDVRTKFDPIQNSLASESIIFNRASKFKIYNGFM